MIKKTHLFIVSTSLMFTFFSCEKSNVCEDYLLAEYAVKDSTSGGIAVNYWYYDSYDIKLYGSTCDSEYLAISNYSNLNNSVSVFKVECELQNNDFSILDQQVGTRSVQYKPGYFENDSIFFEISYLNELGEAFFGSCYGKKK